MEATIAPPIDIYINYYAEAGIWHRTAHENTPELPELMDHSEAFTSEQAALDDSKSLAELLCSQGTPRVVILANGNSLAVIEPVARRGV